jgi:hypothetical protein
VTEVLAFRVGDVFVLTEEGADPPMNLRAEPSRSADVVQKLSADAYLEIIAGPELVGKETWWKVRNFDDEAEGWVMENQTWYQRSY